MKRKFLPFILIALFGLTNCQKNNVSDILVSKTWKRALSDKNPSTNPTGIVLYHAVQNCEKDDTFNFGSDGKLMLNRNADKCDQNEIQNETQIYTINRKSKEFDINGNKFILAEETRNQIKYYAVISSVSGVQYLVFLLE